MCIPERPTTLNKHLCGILGLKRKWPRQLETLGRRKWNGYWYLWSTMYHKLHSAVTSIKFPNSKSFQADVYTWHWKTIDSIYIYIYIYIYIFILYLYCIVLFWKGGHCCPMHCDLFKIYLNAWTLDLEASMLPWDHRGRLCVYIYIYTGVWKNIFFSFTTTDTKKLAFQFAAKV